MFLSQSRLFVVCVLLALSCVPNRLFAQEPAIQRLLQSWDAEFQLINQSLASEGLPVAPDSKTFQVGLTTSTGERFCLLIVDQIKQAGGEQPAIDCIVLVRLPEGAECKVVKDRLESDIGGSALCFHEEGLSLVGVYVRLVLQRSDVTRSAVEGFVGRMTEAMNSSATTEDENQLSELIAQLQALGIDANGDATATEALPLLSDLMDNSAPLAGNSASPSYNTAPLTYNTAPLSDNTARLSYNTVLLSTGGLQTIQPAQQRKVPLASGAARLAELESERKSCMDQITVADRQHQDHDWQFQHDIREGLVSGSSILGSSTALKKKILLKARLAEIDQEINEIHAAGVGSR